MNITMQFHTRRLLIRFGIILGAFSLLAMLLALSVRYKAMLTTTITRQDAIVRNIAVAQATARETEKIIAEFNRFLPPGYGSQSPERLLYGRLDSLKESLQVTDITVKAIENKEGMLSVEFSVTVPLGSSSSYATALNLLGRQETLAFPFVSINSVTIDSAAAGSPGGLQMNIEGTVLTPAPVAGDAS